MKRWVFFSGSDRFHVLQNNHKIRIYDYCIRVQVDFVSVDWVMGAAGQSSDSTVLGVITLVSESIKPSVFGFLFSSGAGEYF